MKLLQRFGSPIEAQQACDFLRQHGIAAQVTGADDLGGIAQLSRKPGRSKLWVMLDEQYEDALQLLENPDHQVEHPLEPEHIELLDQDIHGDLRLKFTLGFVAVAVLALGAFLFLLVEAS